MGVLLEAKHRRLIPVIKPVLNDLRIRGGMWLSEALYEQTLRTAGE